METKLYAIRYRPGTDLARRWPESTAATWPWDQAQAVRNSCPNGDRMELVPA